LLVLERRPWKRFVPNPYRAHIRRVCSGRVLDVGCGIGRCLGYLGGRATGVDPNVDAVRTARDRGFDAATPAELHAADGAPRFDTLLCSHVLEHLLEDEALALLREWLPRLERGGRVVLVCPQARGQASDPTHVRLMTVERLRDLATRSGITVERTYSFPLPRAFGRIWVHNETVLIGHLP